MANHPDILPHIESLLARGPVIVFLWRFEEDFPVEHVTENVRQLGYTPEDFTSGRVSWPDLTHPDDDPRLRREVEEALAGGRDEFKQTYRLFDSDGRVRWIEDNNLVIRNEAGDITHIQGVILDVTERKGLEEAYISLVRNSFQGALIIQDARAVFCNQALADITGFSVEEILAMSLDEGLKLVSDDTREAVATSYERRMRGEEVPSHYEIRISRGDGTLRWLELFAERIDYQGRPADLIVCHDVTDRKQEEESLRRVHAELEQRVAERSTQLRSVHALLQHEVADRRQVEGLLREMVERDQTVSKITTDYAYAFDVSEDGQFSLLWVQGRFSEITGYTPEQLKRAGGFDVLIHPEDADAVWRRQEAVRQGNPGDVEYRIIRKDGRLRWQRDFARPVRDAATGRIVRIYGAVRDVTDTKLTDQELRDTNVYLETIIATSHDSILVVDAEGRFEFGNDAFFDMFGWPAAELLGEFFMKVVPPDLHAFMMERWEEVQRGEGRPYETAIMTKEGERRSLLVSHRHMTIGGQRKYCVVCKDITARKRTERELERHRAHLEDLVRDQTTELTNTVERLREEIVERMQVERALRASERRYRMLMEEAGDPVFVLNRELAIVDANPAACELLRYPREQLLRMSLYDFLDPSETERRQLAELPENTGQTLVDTRHVRRSDGVYLTLEATVRRTPDGNVVIFARDVSVRRRLEQQILAAANNEQQRIGRALHDSLGQELTGIAFLTKVLEGKLENVAPELAEEAGRVVSLVSESLTHTRRIARGLSPVDVEAGGFEQACHELARGTENLFGIRCCFESSGIGNITDSSLATHLYHIAQESVTNAIRHGQASDIRIGLNVRGGQGELSIKDNGNGFPEAGNSRKGIGLHVMQYRAEMVGGYLLTETNETGGVTVRCVFEME